MNPEWIYISPYFLSDFDNHQDLQLLLAYDFRYIVLCGENMCCEGIFFILFLAASFIQYIVWDFKAQ